MKRFKNILFIFDSEEESSAALERAVMIVKNNRAKLTIMNVVEEIPQQSGSKTEIEPQKLAEKEGAERIQAAVQAAKRHGIQSSNKVVVGTHFIEIIKEVLRNQHDLVMVSPRKKTVRERLFGTRMMHLMRKCPCPVWAIKPIIQKRYKRIMAAVDPVRFDDERNLLNVKIMELAKSLAQLEEAELHIIHAWTQPAERILRARGEMSASTIDRLVRSTKDIQKDMLSQLVQESDLSQVRHKIHLVKGQPDKAILTMARKKRVELVVMGTVCRTGISGFLIGNTAEKVLGDIRCSVLAVKPDGFVSPVTLN